MVALTATPAPEVQYAAAVEAHIQACTLNEWQLFQFRHQGEEFDKADLEALVRAIRHECEKEIITTI